MEWLNFMTVFDDGTVYRFRTKTLKNALKKFKSALRKRIKSYEGRQFNAFLYRRKPDGNYGSAVAKISEAGLRWSNL